MSNVDDVKEYFQAVADSIGQKMWNNENILFLETFSQELDAIGLDASDTLSKLRAEQNTYQALRAFIIWFTDNKPAIQTVVDLRAYDRKREKERDPVRYEKRQRVMNMPMRPRRTSGHSYGGQRRPDPDFHVGVAESKGATYISKPNQG